MIFEKMKNSFDVVGYDQMEVYATETTKKVCSASDNQIESVEENENLMFGIRVLKDNKVGFASTSDTGNIFETARKAVKLAKISQNSLMSFPVKNRFPDVQGIYDDELGEMSSENMVSELGRCMENVGSNVTDAKINVSNSRRYILNSSDVRGSESRTMKTAYFNLSKEGISRYSFDLSTQNFDAGNVASEAKDVLQRSMNRTSINKGSYDIILTPFAQRQIISGLLFPPFDSERVQNGNSMLEGRMEEQVFSEAVSIVDDGRLIQGNGTRSFDREGTGSKRTVLVDDGVLKNYLYDVKRAERAGRESTGNAGGDASSLPNITPTNFVLNGDEGELNDENPKLVIRSVTGVHTADTTSGDYALNINTGFLRHKGEEKGIKSGVMKGNIFELFKNFSHFYGERKKVGKVVTRPAVFRDQEIVV